MDQDQGSNQQGKNNPAGIAKKSWNRLTGLFGGQNASSGSGEEGTRFNPLADAILMTMQSLEIRPTPKAYHLFYAYLSGERPDLAEKIQEMRRLGEEFSAARIAELHEQFFGAEKESDAVYEASRNVEKLLVILETEFAAASNSSADHSSKLSKLGDALEREDKKVEINKLVQAIVSETANMRKSITSLERRVVQSSAEIATLRENLTKVQREANTDPLTGIGNRKLLEHTLKQSAGLARDLQKPFSLLMLDLDHFKSFNDQFGHQIGDLALQKVSSTIVENIKGYDLAARYGGEELAVVLANTKLDDAITVAEKLRREISAISFSDAPETASHQIGPVTVSIGAAEYRTDEPLKRLVGRCDRALYQAKREGRDQVASERDVEVIGRPKSSTKSKSRV